MSGMNVLIFLDDTERALVMALLEERLDKLLTTIRRTDNTDETASLRYLVKTTVTLLDKLHQASAVGHAPPERPPPK